MKRNLYILASLLLLLSNSLLFAQNGQEEYLIRKIIVETESERIDKQFVIKLSGLKPGSSIKVPGDDISKAIRKLWDEKVFSDIKIFQENISNGSCDLVISLQERPRLSAYSIRGVKKGDADDLKDKLHLFRGEVITEYLLKNTEYRIKEFYAAKNYLNVEVNFTMREDTNFSSKAEMLIIDIKKNEKVRVNRINIEGNGEIPKSKIRKKFKNSLIEKSRVDVGNDFLDLFRGKKKFKEADSIIIADGFYPATIEYFRNAVRVNIFKSSKYVKTEYQSDKAAVIEMYNAKGFRDAKFLKDSVYLKDGEIFADFVIDEGQKYYFRNITWVGNKRYRSGQLDTLLNIQKGDVYSLERLDQALNASASGRDITSLYQDIGYLFFHIEPVEVMVEGDSIDLEIRIYEGKQARIRNIIVRGNTKTSERVILREIRSRPGDLFSRTDIMRSQTALAQLGIFDAQAMDIRPIPNPEDGTVDIEYTVAEAPSDQIELSGGWGANQIVGRLGLTFNNFSLRNFFKKGAWTPLPSGDGQKLSISGQTNGKYYQGISFSFTEPWLGGKKPISFSVFASYTNMNYGSTGNEQKFGTTTVGLSVGRQLKWPDDFFSVLFSLTYQRYDVLNFPVTTSLAGFSGNANNLSFTAQISRNSLDDWIFPSSGSQIVASGEFTLPIATLSGKDMTNVSLNERYKWIEYHKWKFKAQWYVPFTKNRKFVMMVKGEIGYIGMYNSSIGLTPFQRFYLGGSGLTGFNIDGREIIALRGYPDGSLAPGYTGGSGSGRGAAIYTKYTAEFRYLISPNPQAKIFALVFLEAGNSWEQAERFQPFRLNRSAGLGVRIFLPMFGLLGVDYGWGFDPIEGISEKDRQIGNFHFMIGQQF